MRLELVLSDPGRPWPPIDPEGWADNFFAEREASLRWLNNQSSPDWQATYHHPQMGPMSAELLLANWSAHDLFHIRQVADLHFAYLAKQAAPVSLNYSGWE